MLFELPDGHRLFNMSLGNLVFNIGDGSQLIGCHYDAFKLGAKRGAGNLVSFATSIEIALWRTLVVEER